MQVILLQDVAKIGRKNDVVKVPDGYGMNKLIPQKLAKPATAENLKNLNQQSALKEDAMTAELELFNSVAEALKDQEVALNVKANPNGKLFEAIKANQVIEVLNKITKSTVPTNWLVIPDPIKTTGEHAITLHCQDKKLTLTLTVSE